MDSLFLSLFWRERISTGQQNVMWSKVNFLLFSLSTQVWVFQVGIKRPGYRAKREKLQQIRHIWTADWFREQIINFLLSSATGDCISPVLRSPVLSTLKPDAEGAAHDSCRPRSLSRHPPTRSLTARPHLPLTRTKWCTDWDCWYWVLVYLIQVSPS